MRTTTVVESPATVPAAPPKVGLPALSTRAFAAGVVSVTSGATQSPVVKRLLSLVWPAVKFAPERPKPAARQADATSTTSASRASGRLTTCRVPRPAAEAAHGR